MRGSVFRQCWCRDPVTRKQLHDRCPELKKKDHGRWYFRYDAPRARRAPSSAARGAVPDQEVCPGGTNRHPCANRRGRLRSGQSAADGRLPGCLWGREDRRQAADPGCDSRGCCPVLEAGSRRSGSQEIGAMLTRRSCGRTSAVRPAGNSEGQRDPVPGLAAGPRSRDALGEERLVTARCLRCVGDRPKFLGTLGGDGLRVERICPQESLRRAESEVRPPCSRRLPRPPPFPIRSRSSAANPPAIVHQALPQQSIRAAFTGCTYPDAPAGLAACQADGAYQVRHGIYFYTCPLNDPDEGVYNLWITVVVPST
jgi:hypothetical protein